MSRHVEEPVVRNEDGPIGGSWSTHPAFGQISASRRSGRMPLYGSDFIHNHHISIRIAASELRRDLSHDSYFAGKQYIEVVLSEAQWATFVSSLNVGDGVPCTVERLNGKSVPELPDPSDRVAQFSGEVSECAEECLEAIAAMVGRLDEMKLPKGKTAEIKSAFEQVVTMLKSNLPFIANSFSKHAETTAEKAKQEVHGYMASVLTRAGLAALQENMPLLIEQKEPANG